MRKVTWTEVEDATFGDRLPAGGYVVRILKVEDEPSKEQLVLVYDIAEGEHKGIFEDLPADKDWTHRIYQKYSDSSMPFFKSFLTSLEQSNPSFSIAQWQQQSNENELVGLIFGAVFGDYTRVSEKSGKRFTTASYSYPVSVSDIRLGKFTVPEPKLSKEAKKQIEEEKAAEEAAKSDPYGEPLLF